jgi:hypothetical protein
MPDYIPRTDADFLNWAENFSGYLTANYAALDLTQDDAVQVTTGYQTFEGDYSAHLSTVTAASAAKEKKDTSRDAAEELIRSYVRRIQANPDVTDTQRAAMGITVPDRTRSTSKANSIGSRPIVTVDTSQRMRHEIAFVDESTPTLKAKPAGVMGCEIWNAVTAAGETPSVDVSAYSFVALDTATPYVTEYEGTSAGKTAHYILRWVKTNGEKGPWSETVSATIVG